jgi:hypothetical protein
MFLCIGRVQQGHQHRLGTMVPKVISPDSHSNAILDGAHGLEGGPEWSGFP